MCTSAVLDLAPNSVLSGEEETLTDMLRGDCCKQNGCVVSDWSFPHVATSHYDDATRIA